MIKSPIISYIMISLLGMVSTFLSIWVSQPFEVKAWPNGISGYTGAPGTGTNTCASASCHFASSVEASPRLEVLHDIPASGFVMGQQYSFSIMVLSGWHRAGFGLRIEDGNGSQAGEITVAASDTNLRVEQGEITHTYFSKIEDGRGTFHFKWTAPSSWTDSIMAYAVIGTFPQNGNIDTLNYISLPLKAAEVTWADSESFSEGATMVYFDSERKALLYKPNKQCIATEIQILDLYGKVIMRPDVPSLQNTGILYLDSRLEAGIYLVRYLRGEKWNSFKILI